MTDAIHGLRKRLRRRLALSWSKPNDDWLQIARVPDDDRDRIRIFDSHRIVGRVSRPA